MRAEWGWAAPLSLDGGTVYPSCYALCYKTLRCSSGHSFVAGSAFTTGHTLAPRHTFFTRTAGHSARATRHPAAVARFQPVRVCLAVSGGFPSELGYDVVIGFLGIFVVIAQVQGSIAVLGVDALGGILAQLVDIAVRLVTREKQRAA